MCKEPQKAQSRRKVSGCWSCHALVGDVAGQGWPQAEVTSETAGRAEGAGEPLVCADICAEPILTSVSLLPVV